MIDPQLPCVFVVNDLPTPDTIIKNILKVDILPEGSHLTENIKGFSWKIDNKYYRATVNLCPLKTTDALPEDIFALAEGLILFFDSKNIQSFQTVKNWSNSLKDQLPEVLLLVCDSFNDSPDDSIKSTAQIWCLQNGYELIELENTETEEEDDDYNIIVDKKGVDRVTEALQTHMWSNLEMKPKSNGFHAEPYCNGEEFEDDETAEGFSELFSQLHSMKESIQSLPLRDRRACAEQVVSTFWKAIGGDEDEIDDILF